MGTTARSGALFLLDGVLGQGRLLSDLSGARQMTALAPGDRAAAQRLAADTLRGLERADRLLARHLRKPPPLPVRNALRLGTVELAHGGASHGVVSALVNEVAGMRRHGALKGLVNAVLRKVAAQMPEAWDKLRVPRLPNWLRKPLVAAWGAEGVAAMEQAHFQGAPLDLTPMPGAEGLPEGQRLPTGTIRLEGGQVSALPGFAEGRFWVQDAAAAMPVQLLAPRAGERILDLCAAPGGKTLQLAAAGADVLAADKSEPRMARLHENLSRTGLKAETRVADAFDIEGTFDAVLLDAPCSATGTIRRHPDLPHARSGEGISELIALQSAMIDHAWSLVKPGGRMVFCTCSLLPDEGEVQLEEALARHPDMEADKVALERDWIEPGWITPEGGLRLRPDLWPEQGGMDGFFIAVLRRARVES